MAKLNKKGQGQRNRRVKESFFNTTFGKIIIYGCLAFFAYISYLVITES